MANTSRCLVTGGSGYFGSILIQRLLERGRVVASFDKNAAEDTPPGVEFIQGDIRDPKAVRDAVRGVDVIYHNVAQNPLAKHRHEFETVNIDGVKTLLAAALEAGARKVVHTSSTAIYGAPRSNPVTEETEPLPGEAYGEAKLRGELVCREFAGRGLDVSVIRPRTILGHGRLGIFQILFEWVREGSNIPVLGRGDNVFQFIHSDDLAEAIILAGERPGFAIYNVGAERFGTMRQMLEALCRHAGTGSRVRSVPMAPAVIGMKVAWALGISPLAPYHSLMYGRSLWYDNKKAKAELNWTPKFSNDEMIIDSYEWYLKNRDMILAQHGASHHRSAVKHGILKIAPKLL